MDQLEYYAYLATTVPPGELARAAGRRLAQRARALARRELTPTSDEVLEAFCAQDARDLALKLSAPRASHLWADASRRVELASVAARVPGAIGRALARADAAWQREFDVFGTPVRFGRSRGGIDWHLDALNGGRFDAGLAAHQPPLWRAGLDPKAAWALARFDQALALGQGVWLSPSEEDRARYAQEFVVQVRDFVRANPPGLGIHWASPMEVALRAVNLSLAFLMMRFRPELQAPGFALDLARLLLAHGRHVDAHLENGLAVPNNHYVADLVGLLHLGVVFPELPQARDWRERAAAELREQIERQVLDDGFTFEGSTSYHRLATELFTSAWLIAQAGKLELGEAYGQRLHGMYRAVRVYLIDGGRAPQIGDNDSGRALPLAARDPLEHGYLLPLGAALFDDPELKPEGSSYCDEALYLLGASGLERFAALPECGPARSASLRRAGVYVLRSPGMYCAVACGPNGQSGVGGHGHNDKLGIEVHDARGPVIVDTGTCCYSSDAALRNAFRSTAAHSTVQVDGAEQSRIPEHRLFALPDEARARMLQFESSPMRERFVGEQRGYERLPDPVRHRREVVWERSARALVVLDRLSGAGEHRAVSRFHLPDAQARLREVDAAARRRLELLPGRAWARGGPAIQIGPADAPRALLVALGAGELRLRPSLYSPGYGVRADSLCVELAWEGGLPAELGVAILLGGDVGEGRADEA